MTRLIFLVTFFRKKLLFFAKKNIFGGNFFQKVTFLKKGAITSLNFFIKMDYEVFEMPPRGQRRISDYGRAFVSYFSRMLKAFGWRFLCFLLMSQLLLKGFAHYLIDLSLLPLFKGGGQRGRIRFWSLRNTNSVVDAKMLQLYTMVIMVPWSLKPIMGLLSDFLLIFGYHKRFWLFLVCVLGMMASVTFTVFFSMRNVVIMVVCFAVIQLQISVFDLLSESAYSERMRDVPQSGTDLVTLTQGYQDVGAIVTAVSAGPLAETGSWYVFSGLVIACTTLPLIPTAFNWLGEKRWPRGMPLTQKQHVVHTVSVETSSKWQVAVIVFAGLAAPVTAVITTTYEPRVALAVALSVVGIALTGTYWAFSPLIFRIVLYQVGTRIFSPSLGSAMDYFYTADEQCLPGGPHFSFVYYMTYVSIVGTVVSFFASMFYQAVLSGMRFRHVLIFTQVLSGLIGFSDLFIVTRTNIAMVRGFVFFFCFLIKKKY
jgi:hypothetical protein